MKIGKSQIPLDSATKETLKRIPIGLIETQNYRISPDGNEDLERSLLQVGQLAPIRVRYHPQKPRMYQVIFGNRRLEAAKKIGWKTINAEIVKASETDSLVLAFTENSDRKDFTDYEKAVLLEKIHTVTGMTYTEIARLTGKSNSFVSQHIAMLHLFSNTAASDEERTKVLCAITEKHARILQDIEDDSERWNTAKLVVAAHLGVRELERLCVRPKRSNRTHSLEESAIRRLVEEAVSGFNSKDIRAYLQAQSSHFSIFSRFPPFDEFGGEAYRDHICSILRRLDKFQTEIRNLNIRLFGNFAFATMNVLDEFIVLGRQVKTKARSTMIFAKENDWKIIHEHWSLADDAADGMWLLAQEAVQTLKSAQ